MNKNAIKKFAIEARKKLIDSVTDKAGMIGITEKSCSEPITKRADFEVYQTVAGTEVTLNKRQCEQRRRLVAQIESRGFEAVVEEVAYTWFNRICAIRFMEVNDYLPNRVRVLSSEKEEKMEPDLVTQAPDVDLDLTAQEKEEIINWKMSGTSEDTDKMFGKLFLKQCHQLHDILPGLFEADSDYMELLFGISYTNKDDVIYMLVNPETGIPEADFNVSTLDEEGNPTGQVEIIGWLYQYYNTELKDDTFAKLKKNVKITKERIPAATQLFTPDWIVRYMVENSVGRIWIEHLRAVDPTTDEKTTAERFGWKYYLPEAEQEEEVNIKLAEIRTTYKDLKPTDITCIDPCMGSGHILIAMFDVLMDIYESAGYDKREAAFEIVKHNIHGLDIDQRAYQLAYFAVMMKGRGYNRRFLRGRDGKPEPKIYVIVENNEINRNHLQFFGTHLSEQERNLAVIQIEGLLDTFKDAREYGSILNVDVCEWDALERFVDDLCTTGQISFESVGSEETQESLHKLVRVAKNLGQKYDAIVTNPPYMGAVSVSTFLLGIDGGVSRSVLKDDARYEFHDLNGTIDPQHQFPVSIESIGDCLNQQNVKWIRSLNSESGKTTVKDAGELTGLAKKAQNQIMTGDKSLVLPLISYYGTRRLYAQKKEKRNLKSLTEFKRQVGYMDCMAAESNEKLMLNWFQMQTLKSLQEQQKTGILDRPLLLETVEKAICRSFERISGARNASLIFDLDTHRLVLEFETADGNVQKFAMDEMSDGYKNTLSMIGDMAYRMAVLNPTLGDHVLEKTPGVVLIDEIDLHLHPQWQQTILSDLHAIFPEVQFIVSSHAPAVINSVPREQIRILDHGGIYMPAAQIYGRDANSILREVMNVSGRPADIKQRMDLFYAYMDENNYKEADKVLTEIESIVGTTDPDIAAARTSLELERILEETSYENKKIDIK